MGSVFNLRLQRIRSAEIDASYYSQLLPAVPLNRISNKTGLMKIRGLLVSSQRANRKLFCILSSFHLLLFARVILYNFHTSYTIHIIIQQADGLLNVTFMGCFESECLAAQFNNTSSTTESKGLSHLGQSNHVKELVNLFVLRVWRECATKASEILDVDFLPHRPFACREVQIIHYSFWIFALNSCGFFLERTGSSFALQNPTKFTERRTFLVFRISLLSTLTFHCT